MSIPPWCFLRASRQIEWQHHQDGIQHDHWETQELPTQQLEVHQRDKQVTSSIQIFITLTTNQYG